MPIHDPSPRFPFCRCSCQKQGFYDFKMCSNLLLKFTGTDADLKNRFELIRHACPELAVVSVVPFLRILYQKGSCLQWRF